MMRTIEVALLVLALLPFWSTSSVAQRVMVVQGGTLIDGNGGPPLQNSTIVIHGDRIREIRSGAIEQTSSDATVIDARGKFIIPGLQDAHVHYRDWMPPLFINHGVTTIHDIGSNPPEWIIAQREMLQKGKIVGPRLYTSVLNLWGKPRSSGNSPDMITFDTVGEASMWAQKAVALKADYIKIHEGFTGEMLVAVAKVARENNLSVVGHVPPALDAFQAAERGQTFLEHSSGVGRAITKDIEEIRRLKEEREKSLEGRNSSRHDEEFIAFYTVDPVKEDQLIKLLVAKNVFLEAEWVDPAKHLTPREKEWAFQDLVFLSRPGLSFIPKANRAYWLDHSGRDAYSDSFKAKLIRGFKNWQKFMVKFSASGGRIVVGTAAPNSLPGIDVHKDMQLLADAGMPLMRVIQAATRNIAEMTRTQADLGTIEVGKYADLLVLDANPLEDISNTQKIGLVIKGGKIIDRRYSGNFRNPLPTTDTGPQTNNFNPQPTITGIEPTVAVEGDPELVAKITGKGFMISSVVYVNNFPVKTVFKTATLLEAVLPEEILSKVGTLPIQVFNTGPLPPVENPGRSNKVMFLVKFR